MQITRRMLRPLGRSHQPPAGAGAVAANSIAVSFAMSLKASSNSRKAAMWPIAPCHQPLLSDSVEKRRRRPVPRILRHYSSAMIVHRMPSCGSERRSLPLFAYKTALQGIDVRYVEADTEFARFALCNPAEQAALLRAYVEPDLLVLDDLFLARRIADASAELLQTVVCQCCKRRRSVIVTSNRVVQGWGKYLGDATGEHLPYIGRRNGRAGQCRHFDRHIPSAIGQRNSPCPPH